MHVVMAEGVQHGTLTQETRLLVPVEHFVI